MISALISAPILPLVQQAIPCQPALKRPQGLLLDAMGTLIGLRRSLGSTYAELAADFGIAVDAAAIERAFPGVYRQAPPLAFPGLAGEALLAAERRWWEARVSEVFRACGATADTASLGGELFDRFADARLWQVYPDVIGPLQRWRTAGLQLAVVSNFDQRLLGILAGLELDELFKAVVVSSAAGAAKPSPIPLQRALAALGLEPGQAWHVGDSPEDVQAAAAAGVTCLRIRRP